jgi:hypothetical protein
MSENYARIWRPEPVPVDMLRRVRDALAAPPDDSADSSEGDTAA